LGVKYGARLYVYRARVSVGLVIDTADGNISSYNILNICHWQKGKGKSRKAIVAAASKLMRIHMVRILNGERRSVVDCYY